MSKFTCKCGHIISNVICPNEIEGSLFSDKSEEKFFEGMSDIIDGYLKCQDKQEVKNWKKMYFTDGYPIDISPASMIYDAISNKFHKLTLIIMECEKCRSLWVQKSAGENFYREYKPVKNNGVKVLGLNEVSE